MLTAAIMAGPVPRTIKPDTVAAGPASPSARSLFRRLLRPVLLALVFLGLALLLRHFPLFGAGSPFDAASLPSGWRGWALFLVFGTACCAVGLPRQAVCFAGGLAFGVPLGTLLSLLANLGGCVLAYGWARLAAPEAASRWFGRARGRLARFPELARSRPFGTVLVLRLLPVGSSLLLNLGAGLLRVPVWPFLLATAIGSAPQTLVFVLLGGGARIGHGGQVALAAVLFVLSAAGGVWLMRSSPAAPPGPPAAA